MLSLFTLRDRVDQAGVVAQEYHPNLALIHMLLFPDDPPPEIVTTLLQLFSGGRAVTRFIKRHLFSGAVAALSFVRVRYPRVDMRIVGKLPVMPSGRVEMDLHYDVCKEAAKLIVKQVIPESPFVQSLGLGGIVYKIRCACIKCNESKVYDKIKLMGSCEAPERILVVEYFERSPRARVEKETYSEVKPPSVG
jgi:hypothetical protein